MRKRKQKYRSVITQRIKHSVKKIEAILGVLFLVLSLNQLKGTNAYFTDSANVSGINFTTGWWVVPTVQVNDLDDVLQVGSTHTIDWTANSSDSSVTDSMKINLYYKCGNDNEEEIDKNVENNGHYDWTVPNDIKDNCQIIVKATDSHELVGIGKSNKFSISWMVVLNEIMPNPASGHEWVELYNNGSQKIDARDWEIKDSSSGGHTVTINSSNTDTGNTTIGSHNFLVVYFSSNILNNDGDTVRLFDNQDNLLDFYAYSGTTTQGKSFERNPDGTGDWVDPVPTPGKKNTKDNSKKDFQKYYSKVCFTKKGKPQCSKDFLKSLDLWKEEKKDGGNSNGTKSGTKSHNVTSDDEVVNNLDKKKSKPKVELKPKIKSELKVAVKKIQPAVIKTQVEVKEKELKKTETSKSSSLKSKKPVNNVESKKSLKDEKAKSLKKDEKNKKEKDEKLTNQNAKELKSKSDIKTNQKKAIKKVTKSEKVIKKNKIKVENKIEKEPSSKEND